MMFKIHSLRPYFGNSPDEMAFRPAYIRSVLRKLGFAPFRVRHFDFLHPSIPAAALGATAPALERLEAVPGVRALSGSLLIDAER